MRAVAMRAVGRLRAGDRYPMLGQNLQAFDVAIQIRINRVDIAERGVVELLQDGQLDALVAADAMKRLGESLDDGGRGKRIGGGFQVGPAEQVADASIELSQLGLALVLHYPDDVAGKNRFVHGGGVDQRQLVDLDLRKMLLCLA